MLVDCHTHVWLADSQLTPEFCREAQLMRTTPIDMTCTPEQHWAELGSQVAKAVVLAFESVHLGLSVGNDFVAAYCRQHPGRLFGFASVDPHWADPVAELERAKHDLGLVGLKMAPVYQGIHPLDERCLRIWAAAERLGLPVLFHQGTTFPRRAPLKYAHPELLEDVALAFPDLKVWIAHWGHPWEEETIVLIRKQPNVYTDLSGLWYRPWQYYNILRLAQEYQVLHKCFFGSDYPIATPAATAAGTRAVNDILEGTKLPRVDLDQLEAIIARDALAVLEIEA
ncbi:MAG: amidohydrolase [Fimbriimonadaceae bacterium]|nr:amidohydrolase [Fimbriimonadaceae bacterium]